MQQNNDLISNWIAKAKNDLKSALKLAKGDDPLLDTAVYHCQQSAEKALKGYLVLRNIEFKKSHDLNYLIKLLLPTEPDFFILHDYAELLTPMAVEFRYPDDSLVPTYEEYELALNAAVEILNFVENKMFF